MMELGLLLQRAAFMQSAPTGNEELKAVTFSLNALLIGVVMFLVLCAVLYTEITKRKSAEGTVKLEEGKGRVVELGSDRIVIRADMAARNHSSLPASLKKVTYSIYMDGDLLGSSSSADRTSFPPGLTVNLTRSFGLSLQGRPSALDAKAAGKAPCKVVGRLLVGTAYGDTVLPFAFEVAGGVA